MTTMEDNIQLLEIASAVVNAFAVEDMDKKIDELWNKVSETNPKLLYQWIAWFPGQNYYEQRQNSKMEAKKTLTIREYQTDPTQNFLCKLMSNEPRSHGYGNRRRDDLAILFFQAMGEDPYWKDLLLTTFLELLHIAARFENLEEVKRLMTCIEKHPEITKIDSLGHGFTPLHSAAMAIHPNAEIAKMLIEFDSKNGQKWLNKQNEPEKNTALHIAASNVNVTEDFIKQFEEADSKLQNRQGNTPYHVAARSRNQETILHMLNTFAPTNQCWDVDSVDVGKQYDKIINICATMGNAKAVALLIKHGADISKGVLHEIVLASVRHPEQIDQLIGVYHVIVDNAVTWCCLEEKSKFIKFRGSEEYTEDLRTIMIWLLTNPVQPDKYEGKNVIECALDHGAHAMFWQIIHTYFVFRRSGRRALEWVPGEKQPETEETNKNLKTMNSTDSQGNAESPKKGREWYWTVFDVTNFTEETLYKPSDSDSAKSQGVADRPGSKPDLESSEKEEEALIQTQDKAGQERNNNQNSRHNFDVLEKPDEPYLTYLLLVFNQWKKSNILCRQPLKGLSQPYITLVQRIYGIFGLLQLIFMVLFTVYHMPTNCSLARMFNISNAHCSNVTENEAQSNISQQRSWIALLWLIWPTILIAVDAFITFHYIKQMERATQQKEKKIVFKSKDLRFSLQSKVIDPLLQSLLQRCFCVLLFFWMFTYFWSKTYELYVETTALVLLFGWTANLELFGAVSKDFSIFSLVVKKMIVKDIPSFMLFFGFNVVGYSLAMHALRMKACNPNEFMDETFFSVLSSAFGIGDFFEVTMMDSTCAEAGNKYLFELVYFGYVCATMITLLNVLIAMMNNRYEKSKPKTENIWRFQMLSTMKALQSHKCLVELMRKLGILPAPIPVPEQSDDSRLYGNEHCASLFYNTELKRYYLQMVLPVDEELKKLGG